MDNNKQRVLRSHDFHAARQQKLQKKHPCGGNRGGHRSSVYNNNIDTATITFNNINNHLRVGPFRFTQSVDTHRWGLLPPFCGGKKGLANLPTTALPYPSFPALYRQDTTYAWRPAFGWYSTARQITLDQFVAIGYSTTRQITLHRKWIQF